MFRNAKGLILANFKNIGSGSITYDRKNDEYIVLRPKNIKMTSLPAPVQTFLPNDFGLYHMSGNVAEMLSNLSPNGGNRTKGGCYDSTGHDIQINAKDEFEGWTEPSQFIGFRPIFNVVRKN